MLAQTSQQIKTRLVDWYCEITGEGPKVLLIHGTAASSHSWRKLIPELSTTHHVLNVDLPGHGQSVAHATSAMSLDGMSVGLNSLLSTLNYSPDIVVGHSAGAMIGTRLCARLGCKAQRLVSFNGAFFPFAGAAGQLFSPIAKLISIAPFVPNLVSAMATRQAVERLLRDTGSRLSDFDIAAYLSLFKKPSHISAALSMMANWDLSESGQDLAALTAEGLFVAGTNDKTVPPDTSNRAARLCVKGSAHILPGFGHLLHEEAPAVAAAIIRGDHTWPS
jgi:magnesium chelatase accessory protein